MSKQIPLALVAPGRRWHLVRDLGRPVEIGRAVSLCGRVYQTSNPGWTQTAEPQDWQRECGHCHNVQGGDTFKPVMIDQEASDEPA